MRIPRAVGHALLSACLWLGFEADAEANTLKRKYASVEERKAAESRGNEILVERLRAEGLTPENNICRGSNIRGATARMVPWPFPKEVFPYAWDFRDGSLSGINGSRGTGDLRSENGTLRFATTEAASISWGDIDPEKRSLDFGFFRIGQLNRSLVYLQLRIRQSLEESVWQAKFRSLKGGKIGESKVLTVAGTDWQTVVIEFPDVRAGRLPITGIQLLTETPGNSVEIDWVKPCCRGGRPCYRRTFTLPDNARWARCSISGGPQYRLYVNGQEAAAETNRWVDNRQIWNYDLDPALFHAGENVLAFENEMIAGGMLFLGEFLLDGALVCADGSYHRFDSDGDWNFKQEVEGQDWIAAGFDDNGWGAVRVNERHPSTHPTGYWFNPSWKGRMQVRPVDRKQPVYGSQEEISLQVSVPKWAGETHEISFQVFDEMGDGFRAADKLVGEGKADFNTQHPTPNVQHPAKVDLGVGRWMLDVGRSSALDDTGILTFPAGSLPRNRAYAVVFRLTSNADLVETYRYEIAVCGPIEQPVVDDPRSYTDRMDLKLVWENDAAAEQEESGFLACDANGGALESKVIETPLGRFRQTGVTAVVGHHQGGAILSFKYTVENPGRPHLAMAEYPDDTVRCQEMRVNEMAPWGKGRILGNDAAIVGLPVVTHTLQHHHCVFFPDEKDGTVTFYAAGNRNAEPWDQKTRDCRVGKIRIYEILNDIPMRRITDAPGPRKWLGQQPESGDPQLMQSCICSPIAVQVMERLRSSDMPNFYRMWMITYMNMIKRLRFAGENTYFSSQYQYDQVINPSEFSEAIAKLRGGGDIRDSGVLMAKLFGENDMAWFTGTEICAFSRLKFECSDAALAEGKETLAQVDRHGHRYYWGRRNAIRPNWIHPEVREKYFGKVVNEWIDLYGGEKGWQGILFQVNEALGPSWLAYNSDPLLCSYDDYTISVFEKEAGVTIPVAKTGMDRFPKRYEWLMANARDAWLAFRARKMTELYGWIRDRLKQTRPDLLFVLNTQAGTYNLPPYTVRESEQLPVQHYAMQGGFDKDALKNDPGTVLAYAVRAQYLALMGKSQDERSFYLSRNDRLLSSVANDGINGVVMRINFFEFDVYGTPAEKNWPWDWSESQAYPQPSGAFYPEWWCNIFLRTNPTLIAHGIQDYVMWMGREVTHSRFAQAFRSLPAAKYTRLTGNGRDKNVWIATCSWPGTSSAPLKTEYGILNTPLLYGYVANSQWWPVDAQLRFAQGAKVHDLIADKAVAGDAWQLRLAPYEIRTFRAGGAAADTLVASCTATVPAEGGAAVKELLEVRAAKAREFRGMLQEVGRLEETEGALAAAGHAVEQGDLSAAYDILHASHPLLWLKTLKGPGREPRRLTAVKRTGEIAVDGDLKEWPEAPAAHVKDKEQVLLRPEGWKGPEDNAVTIRAQWDESRIFLAFDVVDDALLFNPSTPAMHDGDCLELFLDADLLGDFGKTSYDTDDSHLKLAPPAGGEGALRVWRRQGSARDLDVSTIESGWARTADGYRVEIGIPWTALNAKAVKAGLELGFDMFVNDGDGKSTMVWSADRPVCSRDPSKLGRLVLGE